jgi:hypothetical protein
VARTPAGFFAVVFLHSRANLSSATLLGKLAHKTFCRKLATQQAFREGLAFDPGQGSLPSPNHSEQLAEKIRVPGLV